NEDVLDDHWSELEFPTPDHSYMTMKFATDSLDGSNPFKLLADGVSGAKDEMGLETLVVVGSVFRDGKRGFYLLSSRHAAGVRAHGEDCSIQAAESQIGRFRPRVDRCEIFLTALNGCLWRQSRVCTTRIF